MANKVINSIRQVNFLYMSATTDGADPMSIEKLKHVNSLFCASSIFICSEYEPWKIDKRVELVIYHFYQNFPTVNATFRHIQTSHVMSLMYCSKNYENLRKEYRQEELESVQPRKLRFVQGK